MRSASRLRVERSFGRITSKGLREGLRKGLREELREALQDELERRGSRSSDELRAASNSFEQLRTASSFLEERRRRFEEPRAVPKSCEHLRRALNILERLGRASRSVEEGFEERRRGASRGSAPRRSSLCPVGQRRQRVAASSPAPHRTGGLRARAPLHSSDSRSGCR